MPVHYNEEDFKNNIEKLIGKNANNLLIFYANWCPDCRNIEKFDEEFDKICKEKNLNFYKINVGDKDNFRSPNNYFMNLKEIDLKKIPTGIIIKNGVFNKNRLIEEDFLNEDKRNEFFN